MFLQCSCRSENCSKKSASVSLFFPLGGGVEAVSSKCDGWVSTVSQRKEDDGWVSTALQRKMTGGCLQYYKGR